MHVGCRLLDSGLAIPLVTGVCIVQDPSDQPVKAGQPCRAIGGYVSEGPNSNRGRTQGLLDS